MIPTARARVFMSGRSQAVRIPVEYRFASKEVFIRRDPQSGDVVLSENPLRQSLDEIFAAIDSAGGAEDLLHDRDTSAPQDRDWM